MTRDRMARDRMTRDHATRDHVIRDQWTDPSDSSIDAMVAQRDEESIPVEGPRDPGSAPPGAEEASRREHDRWTAVARLARGVVHDLANAMFPLRCHLEVLRRRDLPAELRAHLEAMAVAASRIDRLGENLRTLSRHGDEAADPDRCCLAAWWGEHRGVIEGMLRGPRRSLVVAWPERAVVVGVGSDLLLRVMSAVASEAVGGDAAHHLEAEVDGRFVLISLRRQEPHSGERAIVVGEGGRLPLLRAALDRRGAMLRLERDSAGLARASIVVPIEDATEPPAQRVALLAGGEARRRLEAAFLACGAGVVAVEPRAVEEATVAVIDGTAEDAVHLAREFLAAAGGRRVVVVGSARIEEWGGIPAAFVAEIENLRGLREQILRTNEPRGDDR